MFLNPDFNDTFYYDRDYLKRVEVIRKDPYRYVLSEKEENKCYHRVKRFFFVVGLPALYLYKHLRYHQELSRVRKLKFSLIQLMDIVPRLAVAMIVLYPLSYSLFVDYSRLKSHRIAKYELQKFDPDWFNYDDLKYGLHNAPAYQTEDSVFGRLYPSRLPFSYFQTAGWIKRIRENNPSVMNEVPPKYEFTPKGPREGTDFKAIENQPLPFLVDSKSV
jgi:hypothetical protein